MDIADLLTPASVIATLRVASKKQALQELASVSAYSYTLLGTGGLSVNVIAALASGIAQDWGIVGTSIAAQADLASIALVTGYDINLGTPL